MSSLDSAIAFAATAHADQRRKYDGLPYITHPIHVMTILHEAGITDEAILIAAVLHDVVEDTPCSSEAIYRRFGERVATLVEELTDVYTSKAFPDLNRKARKAKERERIAATSADAQTIKYADFLSNTASIVPNDPSFARLYLDEKEKILAVARKGNPALLVIVEAQLARAQTDMMHGSLR